MKKEAKIISYEDVKVGDELIYNDETEKLTLTVVKINKLKGDGIDVTWKGRVATFLLESDFKNGYIKRLQQSETSRFTKYKGYEIKNLPLTNRCVISKNNSYINTLDSLSSAKYFIDSELS